VDYGAANATQGLDASKDPYKFTVSVYKTREVLKNQITSPGGTRRLRSLWPELLRSGQTGRDRAPAKGLKVINTRLSPGPGGPVAGDAMDRVLMWMMEWSPGLPPSLPPANGCAEDSTDARAPVNKREKRPQAIKANLRGFDRVNRRPELAVLITPPFRAKTRTSVPAESMGRVELTKSGN